MKRLLAFLLAIMMLFGLSACTQGEIEFTVDLISGVLAESDDSGSQTTAASTTAKATVTAVGTTTAKASSTSASTSTAFTKAQTTAATTTAASELDPDGWYYSLEDVSLYLYTYGCLPSNFITKNEARDLGWEGGSVEQYAPGFAIGGDVFSNREGLLPGKDGRKYYECDIDTNGKDSRGAKRIVFSNDGLIYYTDDHYESFILIYGEK